MSREGGEDHNFKGVLPGGGPRAFWSPSTFCSQHHLIGEDASTHRRGEIINSMISPRAGAHGRFGA